MPSKATEHFRAKNAARRAQFKSTDVTHRKARTLRRSTGGAFGKLKPATFNRWAAGTGGFRGEPTE